MLSYVSDYIIEFSYYSGPLESQVDNLGKILARSYHDLTMILSESCKFLQDLCKVLCFSFKMQMLWF